MLGVCLGLRGVGEFVGVMVVVVGLGFGSKGVECLTNVLLWREKRRSRREVRGRGGL
jgi:hypothetical protein